YTDRAMSQLEAEPEELINTRIRYHRALRLLRQTSQHTVKTLQTIQRDHVNYPDSVCNHAIEGDPLDREKTIVSLLIDLTDFQLHAAWGNPCQSSYTTYQLEC
ncbi:MAG: hypothetical protein GYA17_20105, partial [Chloroflexi bacterium]|nr:hypothetical protein [Chloroflexota bacterium]